MEKYQTPQFVFKNVNTWPVYITYVLALVAFAPIAIFFIKGWYGYLGYGGGTLGFAFYMVLVTVLLKLCSRTVIVYFDRHSMYIGNERKGFTQIPNHQIVGFYSYNYQQRGRSYTSIKFICKHGKTYRLQDNSFAESKDEAKALMLKQFLITAQRRLNFEAVGKSRWRAFFLLGAVWYSNARA